MWCPTIEGKSLDLPSFFMVAGGGLMSSVTYTIPPNLPLIREACGKALPCIASQYEWLPQSSGEICSITKI